MNKVRIASIIMAGLMCCVGSEAIAAKQKLCFVYGGPVGDHGWNYQHDQARKTVESEFGEKVETQFVENVGAGADAERVLERLSRGGCNMIFATTFEFMDPVAKVSRQFPNVKFENATGYKLSGNVSTYDVRYYEAYYVFGKIAASISGSKSSGYLAPFPVPTVVAAINSFALGAQSVKSDFNVNVVWVNSWYDPGKEADAAKVLFGQGFDVLVQQTDSSAAMQVAESSGKKAFGLGADMVNYGPNAQLSSAMNNWAPYYIRRVHALLDGTWKSEATYGGFRDGMLEVAEFRNMPDDVKAMAKEAVENIKSGALQPFHDPLYDQNGSLIKVSDDKVMGMDWFVRGVNGTIEK